VESRGRRAENKTITGGTFKLYEDIANTFV
jgi:hypothetical protein